MMNLPPELYYEIASKFASSERDYLSTREDSLERFLRYSQARGRRPWPDIHNLRNLRLTSKSFNQAATQVLCRFVCLRWRPDPNEDPASFNTRIDQDFLAPGSQLPLAVKGLRIDFTDSDAALGFLEVPGVILRGKETVLPRQIEQIAHFGVFSNLESFHLFVPDWRSEYSGNGAGSAPQLNLDLVASLRASLSSLLSASNFPRLTELRLGLPCTYDFVVLSNHMQDDLLARLTSLSLAITDGTGPGGSKDNLIWADEDGDNDEHYPLSNLQQAYPNTAHMSGIFSIISRCHNLHTLGLEGTQFLISDTLDWHPTSKGLREIYLSRVRITAKNLITLCSPASGSGLASSRLAKVWLENIHLTSGYWDEVFEHLSQLPELDFFYPEDLAYPRDGENAAFKVVLGRQWEDSQEILSAREEDEEGLELLRENVPDPYTFDLCY